MKKNLNIIEKLNRTEADRMRADQARRAFEIREHREERRAAARKAAKESV
jgi:hypothetical protein